MELNLSDIIKNDGGEKYFCEQMKIEPIRYMGFEVDFADSVKVEGSVKNVGGVLVLEAKAIGTLSTLCARCLAPVTKEFCANITENLLQQSSDDETSVEDDSEVIVFTGYSLPLDEIVINSILVSMDVKYLCTPDCKGLCPVCGKNLNISECDCTNEIIDPRFEVLSKLCDK